MTGSPDGQAEPEKDPRWAVDTDRGTDSQVEVAPGDERDRVETREEGQALRAVE